MAKAHVDRRELAELTGYSEAQIVRWELGRAPLYPIELIKLCLREAGVAAVLGAPPRLISFPARPARRAARCVRPSQCVE